MSDGGIWIHHDCKPAPGREKTAAARDRRLAANPRDPCGGMHWLVADDERWALGQPCGICGVVIKRGDAATGFKLDDEERHGQTQTD